MFIRVVLLANVHTDSGTSEKAWTGKGCCMHQCAHLLLHSWTNESANTGCSTLLHAYAGYSAPCSSAASCVTSIMDACCTTGEGGSSSNSRLAAIRDTHKRSYFEEQVSLQLGVFELMLMQQYRSSVATLHGVMVSQPLQCRSYPFNECFAQQLCHLLKPPAPDFPVLDAFNVYMRCIYGLQPILTALTRTLSNSHTPPIATCTSCNRLVVPRRRPKKLTRSARKPLIGL